MYANAFPNRVYNTVRLGFHLKFASCNYECHKETYYRENRKQISDSTPLSRGCLDLISIDHLFEVRTPGLDNKIGRNTGVITGSCNHVHNSIIPVVLRSSGFD